MMPRQSGASHGCYRLPLGDNPKPPSCPSLWQHARAVVANCNQICVQNETPWRHLVFLDPMLLHHASLTEMTHRGHIHIDTSDDSECKSSVKRGESERRRTVRLGMQTLARNHRSA